MIHSVFLSALFRLPLRLAASAVIFLCLVAVSHAADRKPNIIFFLADDLGYGDVGCYGQTKIRTPNIDRLATEGMKFTQAYAGNAVCAPCRCVLMTGKHPGHAVVRDNREIKPEGQFPLPANTVTLARVLKQQGYATGAFGKWGLGGPESEGRPLREGFDRFYGYNCQRVAHNYYPTYLWDDEKKVALNNPEFSAHQKLPAGVDPNDPKNYAGYSGKDYAPDLIHEQALKFVRDHKAEPFFLFVPTTVPHLALQVPADSLAEYLGKWPETPYTGDHNYLPHFAPRAAYAAMVTRMDREIGRLLTLLHELQLDDNTIFIFSSDNGPLYDQLGGTDTDFFNSAQNLRGRKGSLYEGGFREPFIVRWPGRVAAGTVSQRVIGFEDVMPTLLDLIGAGNTKPSDIDGVSFAPTLLGQPQPERPFLYREFPGYGGQQLVRLGDWVGVRQNLAPRGKKAKPDLTIELYNLKSDPAEQHNVAAEHPDVIAQIESLMRREHTPSKDFPMPAIDGQ
jgi:arylsulfatase A-like enzyme